MHVFSIPSRGFIMQAPLGITCPMREESTIFSTAYASPVGLLTLVASRRGLKAILWEKDNPARVPMTVPQTDDTHPVLMQTRQQLAKYCAGSRRNLALPLDFEGTDFQKQVWQALLDI